MKNLSVYIIISISLLICSCDPLGMSFVKNNSTDTLMITLKSDFNDSLIVKYFDCGTFYKEMYITDSVVDYKNLWDWYEYMDTIYPSSLNDSLLKIDIPPNNIILTNLGIMATSLFPYCPFEYASFTIGENSDTLFDLANYNRSKIKDFYKRNDFETKKESWFLSTIIITEIYKIN